MSQIITKGQKYYFESNGIERVILDCEDFLSNKSCIPMHRLPDTNNLTIPILLNALVQMEQKQSGDNVFLFYLFDLVLVSRLIRTKNPIRIMEYGCSKGEFSQHIAELIGRFNNESQMVCVNDRIDAAWSKRIGAVEPEVLPRITFIAGDFGDIHYEENYFDIVFINGKVNFEYPGTVFEDAMRMTKDSGEIMVMSCETPLLDSVFQLYFDNYEVYEITPQYKLYVTANKD